MGILNRLSSLIATLGPIGNLPAPGTWGTLCAAPVMYALCINLDSSYVIMITLILIVIAFMAVHNALPLFRGDRDPAQIVIDEFVGFAVVASCIPCSPISFAAAFFLFRFFDILKPMGIRIVEERFEGAAGIILDDLLAAMYSALCVWAISYASFI